MDDLKLCAGCGEAKPLDSFGVDSRKRDGRRGRCRPCGAMLSRTHTRRYTERHREKERARHRAKARKPRASNPLREWARATLNNAIAAGKIAKPESCPKCGLIEKVHGHHHDYSKPFDVEWMCGICHGKEHRKPVRAIAEKLEKKEGTK